MGRRKGSRRTSAARRILLEKRSQVQDLEQEVALRVVEEASYIAEQAEDNFYVAQVIEEDPSIAEERVCHLLII